VGTEHVPLVDFPHAREAAEVLSALGTGPEGLSHEEAAGRLERHGRNALPQPEPPSLLATFLRQFASPLIYVLFAAAAVSVAMGDLTDAGFILAVLVVNATIGTLQEHQAQRSALALRSLVAAVAHVVREGEEREIDAEEVVPGDVVVVASGAKVPADLRLLSGSLEVDESLLTGESMPVGKRPDAVLAEDVPVGDRENMAFAATIAARGRARGAVVATGQATEGGQIAAAATAAETVRAPLLQRMDRFTKKVAVATLVAVAALGVVSFVRGMALADVFLHSVALAVAAIPEGLPVALTVALAIAVRRMAKRRVIARRLAAVEALGSCTYVASDKTGTLTLNELTVQRVLLPGEEPREVTGSGKRPEGEVRGPGGAADARIERLARAAALCNDANLVEEDGEWASHGDSVDVALLVFAQKAGVSKAVLEEEFRRIAEIPFEAERQHAATLHEGPEGPVLSVKGAAERVVPMCDRMATARGDATADRAAVEEAANALAAAGYRVIAVATGEGRALPDGSVDPEALSGLVLLGFVGMIDPLRPGARAAVDACREAGIEVAMVTGDHPVTAAAIARDLGLGEEEEQVVTGPMLSKAATESQAAFDDLVARSHVFARVEPRQKLDLVRSLIRRGHFVAVTGDGANDAPALRAAHIGVAMGKSGTDIARETAELVVTDDDFASIVAGVEEGRVAYGNVRKVVFLLASTGVAELAVFIFCAAWGLPLPLFPAQILWLNLVTNGIQDVALAFEPGEGDELRRPPRPPSEPIFDRLMVERTFLSALLMGGLGFLFFRWMLESGAPVDEARNQLLLLMVLFENVQTGNSRSEHRSLFRLNPLRNPILLVGTAAAQGIHIAAMHTPGLRDVLRVGPVSFGSWLTLLGIALTLFVVVEAHKWLWSLRDRAKAA
jgi:magnesium-transporting ATPase (P-type)